MLKVDLHLHSINSNKIGDSVSWISLRHTINTIRNADISIFSFTDHDMFNFKLYNETVKLLKEDINNHLIFYPGLELTIIRENGNRGHVLFIFDNSDINKIKQLEQITYDLVFSHRSGIKLSKAIEIYNSLDLDYFIIPHVDKSDFLIYEDFKDSLDKLYYLEALANSHQFKRFIKDANNANLKPVKFSDYHHWRDQNFIWSGTYIEKLESFNDLKFNLKLKED